jgi:hypothetical protein
MIRRRVAGLAVAPLLVIALAIPGQGAGAAAQEW